MYSAYTDGSYNSATGKAGAAAVILKDGIKVVELGIGIKKPLSAQIDAECTAVFLAIEWCKKNDVSEIDIYYDYSGVKHWACGEWNAGKEITIRYVRYMQSCKVKIKWHKVKAHSGVYWNEYTDELATKAAR